MPDKIDTLYDALKADGAVTKSREHFRSKMLASGAEGYKNRKQLYDALKADGAVSSKNYEEFAARLGLHAVKPAPAKPAVNTAKQILKSRPTMQIVDGKSVPAKQRNVQPAAKSGTNPLTQASQRFWQAQAEMVKPVTPSAETESYAPGELLQEPKSNRELVDAAKKQLRATRQQQQTQPWTFAGSHAAPEPSLAGVIDSVTEATKRQHASLTAQLKHNSPLPMTKDEVAARAEDEVAHEEYVAAQKTIDEELKEANAERAKLEQELERRGRELEQKNNTLQNNMALGGFAMVSTNQATNAGRTTDPEYKQHQAALDQVDKRIKTLEAAKNKTGFWGGLADALSDPSTYTFGLTDMRNAATMHAVSNKVKNGSSLTASEKSMLQNVVNNNETQAKHGDRISAMYRFGQISGAALPFVVEFVATAGLTGGVQAGIKGVAKGLASSAAKAAPKALGNKAAQWMIRNTGVLAGDVAAGALMANTTGAAKTGADILKRHMGEVQSDGNGGYKFVGGKSLGRSIYEGEVAQTLEYYTEMLGTHFNISSRLAKGAEKIGLSKMSKAVSYLGSNKWLSKAGVQDYPSEVLEEESNIILNSLLVGDNKLSDLYDKKTQADIWGGMALSIGLMNVPKYAGTGYQSAQYYRYKHKTDTADKLAAYRLTPDKWTPIKEQIDGATNEEIKDVVYDIISDKDLHQQQKSAALDYVKNLVTMRGYNLALANSVNDEVANEEKGEMPVDHSADKAYTDGYTAQDVTARKDIKMQHDELRGELSFATDEDFKILDDSPTVAKEAVMSHDDWSENQKEQALAYINAKEALAGVVDRINEDADYMAAQQREELKQKQHTDGALHPATLKEKDEEGHDKEVFIIDGHVQMTEDGSMVDAENSDKSVVVYNTATDKREIIDPTSDTGILTLGEVLNFEDEQAKISENAQQYIQEQYDEMNGKVRVELGQKIVLPTGEDAVVVAIFPDNGNITAMLEDGSQKFVSHSELQQMADEQAIADYRQRNGIKDEPSEPAEVTQGESVVEGAPSDFTPDMELTIRDEDGTEKPALVMGRVRYEDGSFVPDENGSIVEYYADGEVMHEHESKLAEKVVSYVSSEQEEVQDVDTPATEAEAPKDDNTSDADVAAEEEDATENVPATHAEVAEEATGEAEEQTALSRIPKDEKGNPMLEETDPETAWDGTVEYMDNAEDAREYVDGMVAQLTKEVDAAKKRVGKVKNTGSMEQFKADKAAAREEQAAAESRLAHWQQIAGVDEARKEAERQRAAEVRAEEERVAHDKAVAQAQADFEARKAAEAERKAVGNENPMPAITEKWNTATKIDGHKDEIMLPNGEPLKGHYVLHESGASSPSHNSENWAKTDGFPMDANDNSVNDRDYERDRDAQRHTEGIAQQYDQRALQNVPVVSNDGVVLSGNGRTIAGEIAARNNTDGAYVDYLKEYAHKFGFTPEQVEGMHHPRVSFVPDDAMPYTAETFARFNQQEMKSQNKTEQAVKLGKTVSDDSFGRIVRTINGYDTLGDFYNDPQASLGAVNDLHGAGVIPQAQMAEMVDGGRGNQRLSAVGREFLENMLIGKAFDGNPDVVRMLTEIPSMRQSVITALGEISDNIALGDGWALQNELADAVKLVYDARNDGDYQHGDIVSVYARQGRLFADPDELQTVADFNNMTMLMLADVLNDKRVTMLKTTLALYNKDARDSANSVQDIFAGGVVSREEILRNVIKFINNAQRKELDAARRATVERRKTEGVQQDGTPPQVDEAERRVADDGGDTAAERGQSKSNTLSQENTEPRQIKLSDPRTMSDEEKQRRGEMLRDAYAIEVTVGQIVATEEVSARRAAEKWWDENVSEPAFYDTEAGEVEINRNSVESSLAHRYGQMKLDAITSLIDGFENAVYLGTMPDSRERGVVDHYFAYPIMYNGERCYVFCRAMQDANKNRLYVHEVFVAERIKKGDTLQTAASKPHGGISLYRDILANVLDASKEEVRSASEEQNEQSATDNTLRAEDKSDNPTTPNGNVSNSSAGKVTESSEELQGKEDKFTPVPIEDGEDYVDYAARVAAVKAQHDAIKAAENATDTNPTDGQKKAGNYKKGHVRIGAFDISVEQPKGSVRRGKDADGNEWESKMNNTYGYFRGTEGVDGDHIDVFLSNDIDGWNGRKVFVVDQYNPDGTFDEHKVMLGFNDADDAKSNYLANYEKGWENGRRIDVSTTNLEDFEKWISSSHRKTKPFAEYKGVKIDEVQSPSVKYQPIIRATFNKVKREQGIIEPIAEKKRKPFTVFDITIKDPRRPMFGGVYHDGGMAVATNGLVMFVHKEAYDEAKEGKIITSKGDVIEGKFPDWRGAIPKETIPTGLQTEPLLEFVNGALARMKAEKAKKYEVDGALAYIKFQDGNVVCCQLADLQKMLRAAKSIGADDLRLGTDKEFLVAESPAGKAIVIIQGEEKARYNAGYNNFSYEAPTVKGKEEVSDGALDNPYPSEQEVEQEAKDDNTGNVVLKQFSNVLLSADTESQRLATDAALEGLKRAGVPVEVVSDEQAAVMLGEQKGVELSAKQKRALETASPAMQDHHTVVSSADGTKVLKDLDNTIEEYEKLKGNKPNTLIGDIAKVLGATRHGSNSEYASFETKNGKLVTIRLANHNAKVSTFDNNGESEGLSIVITPKENAKLTNDGEAHITEFYYNAVKLRRAEGKPLVEILKSIKQALYSGEYKDTTGLAEVQEVNVPRAELHMVYHGSGADFDAFDHSHMGEGEGQQAYGWGTYVTEVEGIGEQYAEANHGNLDFDEEAFYDEANEYIEEVFGSRDGLDYAYNDGGFEIFNVNRDPETLNYFLDYFKEHPNEFDSWEDPNEIDVSTLDEKGIEELGRALERSMDDVVQEDVQALFEKYMTVPARHLYSVEIPDDTGSNYLDYTKNYADDRSGINTDHFIDALYDEILATDDEHLYDSKQAKKELRKELSELDFSFGKDIYGDISSYLGSDKKASEFLHRQGVVGISYPAQYRSGGREDDARNYVIFDEEDLKITDHVQFMKTPSGTLYGWTVGGKIYLTKDGLNPNTPIHEYTHLWARAMKERNKEGWQSVKELLRDTPVWDEVLKDKNYQDILDDEDAIASEALSRISGKKNAEKMEAEARKMIDEAKDYVDKAKAISLLERMKSALKKFWNWVGKDLFGIKKFSSVDEITDRVLYDLTNGTDLKGAASEKVEKQQVSTGSEEERAIIEHAKESGTYMKAPNGKPTRLTEKQWAQVRTKAFKSWFGDWEKAARIEKLRKSEPVEITGEEYKGKYELNRDSAKAWIKDNLRGEYTIADTGEKIAIGRKGINKVTSHSMGNEAHLKSLIAVPKMLEQSVFITEEKADKLNAQYPTYRYYVVGLNIAGVDYTAKLTIGVDENGNKYYDHALTEIEKGKLLDQINGQAVDNGFMSTGAEPNPSVTDSKDTKLVSILQTNSSKFVDENGEPMVFYHNTNNNFSVFDSKRNGTHTDAGWLGDGFYFYGDENEGSGYGNIKMGVFLNVRDPYYATSEENNQLAEANSRDMSVDFRENLEEEGYDGVFYNGDLRQEAVVFEPNQIKSATDNNGEFSQESDDIRYRESNGSSERTLVGIHNISADKLSKAIKQGGLANPSVAVIDISKQQHTGYGEISLIMPSDKINKRTGKNAGTFEGDAWTPMYPSVERQMSREGSLVMEHDIKALPNEMQLGVRNALRNWLDSRVDTKLSYLYLFQQGKAPDFETIKPKYNKEVHRAFGDIMHEVTNVYDLSKNDIEKLVDLYVKTELNGDINEFNQSYERNIAKHKEFLSNKKPGSLRYEKALIYLRDAEEYGRPIDVLQRFVDEVWRDKNTQGRVSIEKTFDAANKKIKEDGLENDYKKWTDGLNERYQTKEVIFDGFTPSGMRRYVPNTLENVSKLMKKQGRNASNGIGSSFSNFAASVMKANTSLDSIRKKKDKLTNDHQDLDDFEEKWQDVYVDLSRKLQPDANAYDDYGFARLQEAASKADPQAYLQKEYGVTLSDEDTQRLKDMVKAIKEERPSMYFETKFERPVTFDEFAAAVVPHNTDAEIKQQLRDAGLKVVEYEAGNEESRAKAVEEASKSDDIRFRQEERAARELAEVNERFNEELQKQIDGTLPAGHVYQLGMPSRILHSAGIPNLPIELVASRLSDKSMQENHPFDLSEVVDLPNAIQRPLAVFRSATHVGSNVILTNLKHEGRNYIVAIETNRRAGKVLVNSIRSVHYRNDLNIIGWINDHLADYVSEEFRENWITEKKNELLSKPQYNSVDVRKKLISAANILKDFQNPTIDEKNHSALSENALSSEPSHDREAMRNEAVQLSDKLHTPIKIVEDVKDITHSNAEVERRKRNSKGWYDVRIGEVVVVLPNNRDVEDVAATVMHETVAHKGLRELVGEEHYDDFLDEVYKHLRGDLKQRVDAEAGRSFVDDTIKNGEKAKSYEQHRRTAVDELFGDMAEKPFEEFSEGERTLWQKLKEVVRKLLDKFLESLKLPKWFELGDNELRYMLWRSKERLERGKEHPIDLARDMVMREELGLSDAARMRMGDTPDTFKARQRRAVEEKGVVMPGLNDAEVKVVDVPRHSFTGTGKDALRSAERWAKDNITGMHTATNSDGIEFDYNISGKSIEKYVSASSIAKSENLGVHLSVLKTLPNVIANSIEVEEHADYAKDKSSKRSAENEVNAQSLMHRFYGAVNIDGKLYRVKTTIREYADTNRNANAHNYELTKIELLDAPSVGGIETSNRPVAMTSNSSISVAKLLKDVEKSYDSGKKVLDESRKADENPILYRDGGETEDIWKDKSMGLHERTTAAAMRLADKHQENKTLRNDAMRAIGNNLADLRKAMSLQRKFDMATVKRVSDLARVLMNNGYIGDMTQQEVKSLLAAVRNSVGHNDIDRDVQKVMEIMVKNQLRRAEKALGALESIKGSKVNAKGVKVQGKLDAAGAQLMEVFKNIIEPIVNNHTLM